MSERFEKKVLGHRFGKHHKQPRGMAYLMNKHKIPTIILEEARQKNQIIYGTHALNEHLPLALRRTASDYDVYTPHPRKTAHRIQHRLDREVAKGDEFYDTPAQHRGTHRVVHEGFDRKRKTLDDIVIVDYSKAPQGIRSVRKAGLRWQTLGSIEKAKRRILRQPKYAYRHAKDRGDLHRILAYRKLRQLLGSRRMRR